MFSSILAITIEKEPMAIMRPIYAFLGYILNVLFNLAYSITDANSLGITIIVFTVLTRCLMIPSGIKSQRSMIMMRKLQPEVDAIKTKYGNSKDPEIARKMQGEIQALYSSHNYNQLGGCLPMLITLPIFIALASILRQPYMYVDKIGTVYTELATKIMQIPGYGGILEGMKVLPEKGNMADVNFASDLIKVLNGFTLEHWDIFKASIGDSPVLTEINAILSQKTNFETFLGLNLLNNAGFGFPQIFIPILSAGTQFLSAFYNFKVNPPADPSQKSTQMMMMIGMPLFMGYLTSTMRIGVGVYWIAGNLFYFLQQVIITKYIRSKEAKTQ